MWKARSGCAKSAPKSTPFSYSTLPLFWEWLAYAYSISQQFLVLRTKRLWWLPAVLKVLDVVQSVAPASAAARRLRGQGRRVYVVRCRPMWHCGCTVGSASKLHTKSEEGAARGQRTSFADPLVSCRSASSNSASCSSSSLDGETQRSATASVWCLTRFRVWRSECQKHPGSFTSKQLRAERRSKPLQM